MSTPCKPHDTTSSYINKPLSLCSEFQVNLRKSPQWNRERERVKKMQSLQAKASEWSGVKQDDAFAIDDTNLFQKLGLQTFINLSTNFYTRVYDDEEEWFRSIFANSKKEDAIQNQYEFFCAENGRASSLLSEKRSSGSDCTPPTIPCHASSCREVVTSHATSIGWHHGYWCWLKNQNDELFQAHSILSCCWRWVEESKPTTSM